MAKEREEDEMHPFFLVSFKRQDFLERMKRPSSSTILGSTGSWICLREWKRGRRLFCTHIVVVLCYVSHI